MEKNLPMIFFHLQPKIYSGLVIAALFDGFTSHFACVRKCLTWVTKHFVDTHDHEACEAPSQKQKHKLAKKMFHGDLLSGLSQSFFNFLVRLVLPKGVDRPNHGWNPTNQRELHHKTEKTCKWTTNREKGQPWQQKRNQKSHIWNVLVILSKTKVPDVWLTTACDFYAQKVLRKHLNQAATCKFGCSDSANLSTPPRRQKTTKSLICMKFQSAQFCAD